MSKVLKKYININVLDAAKDRIKHLIYKFDTIIVSFSGGKDSLVVLNLVQEVYNDLGIKDKLKVIFKDEELIPDDVINFVQDIFLSNIYDFTYYCIQLKSEKFILGKKIPYIQWDSKRNHIRKIPKYAITDWDNIYDQYSADLFVTKKYKGKKVLITGIRADESLIRLRSVVNKKNDSYYSSTNTQGVMIGKPIYDWSEKDIFKYLYDNKINYAKIYDAQLFNNENLRVSTPLHAESSKKIYKI
ncbi:MAG: peptidase S14, partial [Caulobacteraceae bacterium]|nr:peptidase S14 [Caulobacteraceae bacterium]